MKIDFNFVLILLLAGIVVNSGAKLDGTYGNMLVIFGSLVIAYEMARAARGK
jgi:hypothetical protein